MEEWLVILQDAVYKANSRVPSSRRTEVSVEIPNKGVPSLSADMKSDLANGMLEGSVPVDSASGQGGWNHVRGNSPFVRPRLDSDKSVDGRQVHLYTGPLDTVAPEEPPAHSHDLEQLPTPFKSDIALMLKQFWALLGNERKFSTKTKVRWMLVCAKDGIRLYKALLESGPMFTQSARDNHAPRWVYKVVTSINASPQVIAAVVSDTKCRSSWDADCPLANVVDDVGPSTHVLQLFGKLNWHEAAPSQKGTPSDQNDLVSEAMKIEGVDFFCQRGIGVLGSLALCATSTLLGPLFVSPVVLLGPVACHVLGAFLGGLILGCLAQFNLVPSKIPGFCYFVKHPSKLVHRFDLCLLRHTELDSVGNVSIVERSVSNVRCPPSVDHTRANIYGGGFQISPVSHGNWPSSRVTYVLDMDMDNYILSSKLKQALLLQRLKVLPALRELIHQSVHSETFMDAPKWGSREGNMIRQIYVLEKPVGDCSSASKSKLISSVGLRRLWNNASGCSCWLGFPLDLKANLNRRRCVWDKKEKNSFKPFDWVHGNPSGNEDTASWDPEEWMRGMVRVPTGGLKGIQNQSIDRKRKGAHGTRRLLVDVLSDMAQDVRAGENAPDAVAAAMLAVENRPITEAIIDNFLYSPKFLDAAAGSKSPLERFKYTMAFAVAGLHANARQTRPFVPDLGAYFLGKLENTDVHANIELTGKQPPQLSFNVLCSATYTRDSKAGLSLSSGYDTEPGTDDEVNVERDISEEEIGVDIPNDRVVKSISGHHSRVNERWRINGTWELITMFKGNMIETSWQGLSTVAFTSRSRIQYTMPTVLMSGVMWGDRITELVGEMEFTDKQNSLSCVLKFNPNLKTGVESLFQSRTVSDHVRGEIVNSKTGNVLAVAEGSWLDGLAFDGTPFWEMHRDIPSRVVEVGNT